MIARFVSIKRIAGLAVMAAVVTAAGLGVGAGIAQAKPTHPHPNPTPHIVRDLRHLDRNLDRHFEGSLGDVILDQATGR